jgi:agmatine deiminase
MPLPPRPAPWSRRAALGALAGLPIAWHAAGRAAPAGTAGDSFSLAADFDPAAAVWLGFAHGHDDITVDLARALLPHVRLKYLLRDDDHAHRLQALLARHDLPIGEMEFHFDPCAGYFMRDQAVFARSAQGRLAIVDFRSTLYGTPAWCRQRHAPDDAAAADCSDRGMQVARSRNGLDRRLAARLAADGLPTSLSAEGGGIETNGRGVLIVNSPLWASRNPELSRGELQRLLLALPGVRKLIWLTGGLAEDVHLRGTITGDYVAWGAGGHTDQFVRFVDERTVLLAWPDDALAAVHPVARLTRERMARNFALLRAAGDARGRHLRVLKVPMPNPIAREVVLHEGADTAWPHEWTADDFPARDRRRQGQVVTQLATATYLNFVLANDALVLPEYTAHGTPPAVQDRVHRLFESVLPGRRVCFVDPITANWVGGGLHCATVNEPAAGH